MNVEVISDFSKNEYYDPKEFFLTEEEKDNLYAKLGRDQGKDINRSFIQTLSKVYKFKWEDTEHLSDGTLPEYGISVWFTGLSQEEKVQVCDQILKDAHTIGKIKTSQKEITRFLLSRGVEPTYLFHLKKKVDNEIGDEFWIMCMELLETFGCDVILEPTEDHLLEKRYSQ